MKILHINSYFNGSKFYKNLYDCQVTSGLKLNVFVPISSCIAEDEDVFGDYTQVSKNHNKFDRLFFRLKQYKIYKDFIKQYNLRDYTLLHAHSLFNNGYIAMKAKKKYGIPYIVAVRNTDINIFFKKIPHLRSIGIQILKNADQIVFLSKPYRDETIKKYVPEQHKKNIYEKTSIIPNGIDEYWFENINTSKKKNGKTIKLLQIGDINKNKNIEATIKAIELLRADGYQVSLDVVGKGKDKKILTKINKLNFVNYLGTKTRYELLKIYRNNDVFVLPSIYETFGLVYAEAMSQGLPIIYTKGQGFDGQFKEGVVGYSVDHFDYHEIASAIKKSITNYNDLSKESIVKTKKYNWKVISDQYKHIYMEIHQNINK